MQCSGERKGCEGRRGAGRGRQRWRRRRGLRWREGGLEQAVAGLQVAVVAAGAAVEQSDDDARAPAAVGVSVTPRWWLLGARWSLLLPFCLRHMLYCSIRGAAAADCNCWSCVVSLVGTIERVTCVRFRVLNIHPYCTSRCVKMQFIVYLSTQEVNKIESSYSFVSC